MDEENIDKETFDKELEGEEIELTWIQESSTEIRVMLPLIPFGNICFDTGKIIST